MNEQTRKITIMSQSLLRKNKYKITFNGETIDVEKTTRNKQKLVALALDYLITRDGAFCSKCKRTELLTVEHIVPISILSMMGVDEPELYADFENLCILCQPCNKYKADRLDFADPRTKPILLKYLERI